MRARRSRSSPSGGVLAPEEGKTTLSRRIALNLETLRLESSKEVECLVPLMERPFKFLFPGKECPLQTRSPLFSAVLRATLLAAACGAFPVPAKYTLDFCFLVTGVCPLSRSATVKNALLPGGAHAGPAAIVFYR